MVIGDEPADFTFIRNGKNRSPAVPISLIEEELTNSYFSNNGHSSCALSFAANQKDLKKYRETIEKENSNENIDPDTRLTARFIAATHLLKGSAIFDHGCAMVNLRIEDRKGCVIAQKKISVRDREWEAIYKLIKEAARSLHYQICNSQPNERTCSKSHYTDEMKDCKSKYFIITTTTEYQQNTRKHRPSGAVISGPSVLISSSHATNESKQIMYINPKKGVLKLVGLENDAKSRYESQGYKFDKKQCAFVHKRAKTRIDENLDINLARVVRHNIFESNSNAFIDLKVTNNNFTKRFRVPWSTLKNSASWSGSGNKNNYDNAKNGNGSGGSGYSDFLKKWNDQGKKGAQALGMNKKQLCTFQSIELLVGEFEKADLSFNAKINVHISPASKSDIQEFGLSSDTGKTHTIRAENIVLPKYEKEPRGIWGNLQNSMYNQMSQKGKDAWNKADKEFKEDAKNKRDVEEFDNLSIDDLKMFSQ
jgi:hypothetical protein